MLDVIIIGAGPAGLTAAIYAKRAGLSALVIEKNIMGGGQVLTTYEVDNYPGLPGVGGFDLGMKFKEHADKMEAEIKSEEVIELQLDGAVKKVTTENGTYETRAVVLATGASHAHLQVPGEEELAGMGVSYCATCDGAFFRGRTTVVVGGGDVAIEDAIFLARTCEKVYLVHRRDTLRGAKILQEALFALPNVEVLWDTVVERIEGEDAVEAVILKNAKTGQESRLETAGVFIAVGIRPNIEGIPSYIEQDEAGYIIAAEDGVTNTSGVFVAGDLRTKPLRQIVTAVADGANAITSVQKYLLEAGV
ncbi:MAG: thioredoxin-disulfide reductase [Lachnospiraceae bacterium]|nr:thioredoxin-disulfide reductase [Lachnospiraceae bacterium]